ncbi:hypothetical protein [uncultured Brachyspira sp.]|uniref:hypothetical protein n=1 Tax=uncultured Brachyspira sp. TaxID=221953 RepID=UPI0025E155C1|nr:hypothetical protein [uncultured Brachyspira sp.]
MDKLHFNKYQMFLIKPGNGQRIVKMNYDDFIDIEDREENTNKDETGFKIKITKNHNYIWIYVEFGSTMPHRKKLVNIYDNSERDNIRNDDEAELGNQIFFFYDLKTYDLYLSNHNKKTFFINLFEEYFNKNIEIKEYYKNIDEFLKELSYVSKISFTCKDDIFSTNSTQMKAYKDLTGNSSPTRFTLTFEYQDKLKPITFIKSLNRERENYRISSLLVKGYSKNNNIDLLFNTENLRERITLNLNKTDEGIFKEEDVLDALQTKINC